MSSLQHPRTLRQIRLPSKRPKNVLALRKSDRVFLTRRRRPQSEIYIAVAIQYIPVRRVCTFLNALGYSNTVPDDSRITSGRVTSVRGAMMIDWENDCASKQEKYDSDTGNRTPSCRVRGGNVSRYTISDVL
jgi:hypothetical protein